MCSYLCFRLTTISEYSLIENRYFNLLQFHRHFIAMFIFFDLLEIDFLKKFHEKKIGCSKV